VFEFGGFTSTNYDLYKTDDADGAVVSGFGYVPFCCFLTLFHWTSNWTVKTNRGH